jgi:16S rRNA (uracil1498-N3)-methyltransferase
MRRFFSKELSKGSVEVTLSGDEFHHLKNVLRLGSGDSVELFNGTGLLATGSIDKLNKDSALIIIEGKAEENISKESPIKITLLQGLLKGKRNEEALTSATVLGAKEIRFFTSEFTATKQTKDKEEIKTARLEKAAIEAAKQCGRTIVPDIKGPVALEEAIENLDGAFKIALFENEKEEGLKKHLKNYKPGQSIAVIVGPEGGLSADDITTIRAAGFHTVGIGPRRLRSEAATHSVLSIIEYELSDMGGL